MYNLNYCSVVLITQQAVCVNLRFLKKTQLDVIFQIYRATQISDIKLITSLNTFSTQMKPACISKCCQEILQCQDTTRRKKQKPGTTPESVSQLIRFRVFNTKKQVQTILRSLFFQKELRYQLINRLRYMQFVFVKWV